MFVRMVNSFGENLDWIVTRPTAAFKGLMPMNDAAAFLVHVEPETDSTMHINITARQKQIELIDQLADKAGMTRSAYMVQSALNGYPGGEKSPLVLRDGRLRGRRVTQRLARPGSVSEKRQLPGV
jgi:hypothetical protein